MSERIQRLLDRARGLTLLASGAGLLLWMDPGSADPLSPKSFCFASAAGLFSAFTAMRLWWGAKVSFSKGKAALAACALLAAQALAFAAAPSRPLSEAAFDAWILLFALLFSASDWAGAQGRERRLLLGLAAGLGLCSLWALFQALGLEASPFDAALKQAFGRRASAGFGNPNFLGGFLLLALPAGLWLAGQKPWAWLLVAAGVLAVLATGSKAAWLGLGFQYFAYGHLIWHGPQERGARLGFLKRWAAAGLLLPLLGLALLPQARQRLLGALHSESISFRIQTWKGALSMAAGKPLLGRGQGSFAANYPAHRPQAAMQSQLQHSYETTHPENWALQLLCESGILGLLAFLAFLWLLLRPLWSAASAGDHLALALFLSLAGSLLGNLASLDLFLPSSFYFFTLLSALALSRYASLPGALGLNAEPYAAALLSLCLLFLGLLPSLQSLALWRSSRSLSQARELSQSGNFTAAVKSYDDALQGNPVNLEALYFKASSLQDSGKPAEALQSYDALQKHAPDYVLVHDKRARALLSLGRKDEAAAEWETQLRLDPWFLPGVQSLSTLYASQGLVMQAAAVLAKAAERFPENSEIKKNLGILRQKLRSPR
jgi:O-antigen ligase